MHHEEYQNLPMSPCKKEVVSCPSILQAPPLVLSFIAFFPILVRNFLETWSRFPYLAQALPQLKKKSTCLVQALENILPIQWNNFLLSRLMGDMIYHQFRNSLFCGCIPTPTSPTTFSNSLFGCLSQTETFAGYSYLIQPSCEARTVPSSRSSCGISRRRISISNKNYGRLHDTCSMKQLCSPLSPNIACASLRI